ncbi:hypothetical protein M422DRAFT_183880, partial [Sphaerobolus stellatus SS14]
YRCPECFVRPLLCHQCIVQSHRHLPFHRTEVWNGKFFAAAPLATLGSIVSLHSGHGLCPERPKAWYPQNLTVIDVNGVHDIKFCFCYCRTRLPILQQLLYAKLWPATISSPSTAFTFAALDDYHHHTLTSRKSAHDYWQTLCRKTSNGFPDRISVSPHLNAHYICMF